MATWTVKGADRTTGEDREVEVTADTSEEAAARAGAIGILVSEVQSDLVEGFIPDYAGPRKREAKRVAKRDTVPGYVPLLVLSRVLTVVAYLGYALALLLPVISVLVEMLTSTRPAVPGVYGMILSGAWMVAWVLSIVIPSLMIHAAAASLAALRDIARSTYRQV